MCQQRGAASERPCRERLGLGERITPPPGKRDQIAELAIIECCRAGCFGGSSTAWPAEKLKSSLRVDAILPQASATKFFQEFESLVHDRRRQPVKIAQAGVKRQERGLEVLLRRLGLPVCGTDSGTGSGAGGALEPSTGGAEDLAAAVAVASRESGAAGHGYPLTRKCGGSGLGVGGAGVTDGGTSGAVGAPLLIAWISSPCFMRSTARLRRACVSNSADWREQEGSAASASTDAIAHATL